jgi:hypothetical protein
MYVFGIAMLLGLSAFALATFADRFLSMAREFWAVTVVAIGLGLAWLVDFDLFKLWQVAERQHWIGVTLTGVMVGATAYAIHGVAHLASTVTRKFSDEAESLEKDKNLRRVA